MEIEYYYYIAKNPTNSETLESSKLPEISKLRKDKFPFQPNFTDPKEAEGPFNSIYELKKKSLIFSTIKLQKHKERILKSKNIKEITDYILTPADSSYDITFIGALHHTMVGKISKQKVSGVHFYNPDNTKIIEKVSANKNGVYSARIEKLNKNTGQWIEKEEITNFFPDSWTINQLFHECSFAYSNRSHESGRICKSRTMSGITVKFVIDEEGKILTFYPEMEND
ncbi:MAG: EndoU domain-containing protein [Candidatus Delongbacteria bacterium]|nr:EndoU domain-containing protein [Candidatus Delongbacteria bacterium]